MGGPTEEKDASGPFEKKEPRSCTPRSRRKSTVSMLSVQLERFDSCHAGPFVQYAGFNGKATPHVPTKQLGIFLTMAFEGERSVPMTVITLSTARVCDVIGLICWQYTTERRQPPLREDLEAFSLHMVEADGEVDFEFPPLGNMEPISQFDFSHLGLVQKDTPKKQEPKTSVIVTVDLLERGSATLNMESDSILLKEILQRVLQKRRVPHDSRHRYILEAENGPRVPLDLNLPLSAFDTHEFCLVREYSTRGHPEQEDTPSVISDIEVSMSCNQYCSYIVVMSPRSKLRSYQVQLGISGEKIEIDPKSAKGNFFVKHKAATYTMDRIADCVIIGAKSTGKATFRLVYQDNYGDTRYHDFKTDICTAHEIVEKISHILEMRLSPFREDYLEKKAELLARKSHL